MASSLYRELTDAELKRVVAAALKCDFISAHLLTGGLFNTTYLVETSDFGSVVLRVGPVNRHLLMPFEHTLMEAEKLVYDACARRGIPVSEILAMDTSKTVVDRDFMFVRYIPGRAMYKMELDADVRAEIIRRLGAETAKMHAICAPRFGRITDVARGGGFEKWSECLWDELHSWETVGVPANIVTPDEINHIRALFSDAAPYLDEITQPRLVHTDLWLGNVLVRTDGEKPAFAAIIDADRALWGDPEFEFSAIRWALREDSFWEGYGKRIAQSREARVRRGIYALINRLWNSYVYAQEYNEPEKLAGEMAMAREEIAALDALIY